MKEKNRVFFVAAALILYFFLGFLAGWEIRNYVGFEAEEEASKYWGMHFTNWSTEGRDDYLEGVDPPVSDWICINIRNLPIDSVLEICQHETAHEIFARYCEKSPENFKKCAEVLRE